MEATGAEESGRSWLQAATPARQAASTPAGASSTRRLRVVMRGRMLSGVFIPWLWGGGGLGISPGSGQPSPTVALQAPVLT